jgi:AraC family transcriptional regulator
MTQAINSQGPAAQPTFTVDQTHGILLRKEHDIEAASDGLGWSSLYVSMQREKPYADSFDANKDHLIVLHRDGPVTVARNMHGQHTEKVVPIGGLFILPAGQEFSVELRESLSTIHLYVRSELVGEAASELCRGDPDSVEILAQLGAQDGVIEQAAHSACQFMREQVYSNWAADSVARTLAIQLIRKYSSARLLTEAPAVGLPDSKLRQVKAYIEENLEHNLNLSMLSGVAVLSPIHFARQFKRSTGQSPYQYLLNARIEAAKRLLRSQLPIAEIAFRCGFSHQEHLTRTFRKLAGTTPAAYRREMLS